MPYIEVAVTGEPNPDLSRTIADTVSDLTRDHLRKDPTVTAVSVSYVDPRHWFAGGRSLVDAGTATFWLDIKVVDGTNTKPELASYIEAVFAAMSQLLGGVHEESYVLVHEVPAAAYGFGGRTQEFRFISGRLKADA
jgi:4-oxalocrotonate tautomerase